MKAKLTCSDLMVGDYVYSTFSGKPCKVQAIELSEHEYGSVRVTGVDGLKDIVSLSPIPLTAEVLEKNGFEWRAYGVVLAGEDMALVQCGDYWKIKPNQDSNDTFCYIWYVHELQHALRLCRVDKEIVL